MRTCIIRPGTSTNTPSAIAPLPPLERGLILVCRTELAPGDRQGFQESVLGEGWDWEAFLGRCERLGIAPLVAHHAQGGALGPLPDGVSRWARTQAMEGMIKNVRMLSVLEGLERAFRDRGIDLAPLKGACLSRWLYPEIHMRRMGDLDILVRAADRDRAWEVARSLGFLPEAGDALEDEHPLRIEARSLQNHLPALYLNRVCRLEIHVNVLPAWLRSQAREMEEVWDRTRPSPDGGSLVLALEDHLLFLCEHLANHLWLEGQAWLYWFCDIHAVLQRHGAEVDWEALLRTADRRGTGKRVRRVLGTLQRYWGLQPEGLPALPDAFPWEDLLRPTWRPVPISRIVLRELSVLGGLGGLRKKARYLLLILFPARASLARRYGPRGPFVLGLLGLLHPFLLAWSVVSGPFRKASRES